MALLVCVVLNSHLPTSVLSSVQLAQMAIFSVIFLATASGSGDVSTPSNSHSAERVDATESDNSTAVISLPTFTVNENDVVAVFVDDDSDDKQARRNVTDDDDESTTAHMTTTFRWSRDPLPYDPMLGWYTAATLSGLLLVFLACVGLERIKQEAIDAWDRR